MNRIRQKALEVLKPKRSGVKPSPGGHRYDMRRSYGDKNDVMYRSLVTPMEKFKESVDLTAGGPPVWNQGLIGSCTGQGWAYLNDYVQMQELKNPGAHIREFDPDRYCPTSRNFIYWYERQLMGTPFEDSGAYIRDGGKALATWGVCREDLWPYGAKTLFKEPVSSARQEALQHKVTLYARLRGERDILNCLNEGWPVVFGFSVYESFDNGPVSDTGLMELPRAHDRALGGHCVVIVGYEPDKRPGRLSKRLYLIRNSWGPDWGLKTGTRAGHFFMPEEVIQDGDLSSDFWTLRR